MPAGIYADWMERGKKIEEMAKAMSGIMYCDCELIDHNAANWEDVEKVVSVQMTNLIDAIRIQLNELEHWFERGDMK